jgi:hypothetical protein
MKYLHFMPVGKLAVLIFLLAAIPMSLSCITINTVTPASPESVTPTRPASESQGDLVIDQPSADERFIQGEPVRFSTRAGSDGLPVKWVSNRDGNIGNGQSIETSSLSAGVHQITASTGGASGTVQVRVFKDLWQFYQANMAVNEINRIRSDFNINWLNSAGSGERWGPESSYEFDQKSSDPSRIVALAKLDVLRHQKFSQPLPFAGGNTAYDYFRSYVKQVNLKLDCGISTAGNRAVNLSRNFNVWDLRQSGSQQNPEACKVPFKLPVTTADYVESLYLLLHEGRHCDPADPGHVTCKGNENMDQKLDGGSGHSTAALYLMWVYKYGLYDSPQTKETARITAVSILQNRFCSVVQSSNQAVQSLLNEIGVK